MGPEIESNQAAHIKAEMSEDGGMVVSLSGRLDSAATSSLWPQVMHAIDRRNGKKVVINASKVDYCDGCGLGLLFEIQLRGQREQFEVEIRGLERHSEEMLKMFDSSRFLQLHRQEKKRRSVLEDIGKVTVGIFNDLHEQMVFLGELCAALVRTAIDPFGQRWKDMLLVAETAGVNAIGIVSMLGFLFGLIMAFSSAMPMQQFGVEVYVSDLVAFAMIRVIGPFITAVILAGRSSSAFAAEIGTMKINDEINALTTMGIDPMRFLVVPRVLAAVIMTPLLTIAANVMGLIGAAIVMVSLGFPLVTFTTHVQSAIDSGDIFAGLFKCFFYGWIVGQIGCFRGMQTKSGAMAVGHSTTRAVVTSIVLIVITEGIFAVLYYCLDI